MSAQQVPDDRRGQDAATGIRALLAQLGVAQSALEEATAAALKVATNARPWHRHTPPSRRRK